MVDSALPKGDRIDLLDPDEAAAIAKATDRITRVQQSDPPPRRDEAPDYAWVTLAATEWRRLVASVPVAPPMVANVLNVITAQVARQSGAVAICGSLLGWCALSGHLLNCGRSLDLGGRITAQLITKQTRPIERPQPKREKRKRGKRCRRNS